MDSNCAPKISVLLPVFNGERYLKECIASILGQSMQDFELIIGDNCSTDLSSKIIADFSDPRIRYCHRDSNLGLFANLNQLVRDTRSPLLRILCHDDLLEPNCLKEEVEFAEKHSEVGMFFCKTIRIDENGSEIGKCILGDLPDTISSLECLQHFFYYGCIPGNLSTVCVRKESFDEMGIFSESYRVAGDYEMWSRICREKNLGVIHKHLVRLRSHSNQMSRISHNGACFVEECRKIRSTLLPLLPEEIQAYAKYYSILRYCVLDVHYAMRCVLTGRFKDFVRVARSIGLLSYFPLGILCWLLTVNNHIFRPSPKYAD